MKLRGDPRSELGPGSDPWSTSRCAQRWEPPLELQPCNFYARVTYRACLSMSRISEGTSSLKAKLARSPTGGCNSSGQVQEHACMHASERTCMQAAEHVGSQYALL